MEKSKNAVISKLKAIETDQVAIITDYLPDKRSSKEIVEGIMYQHRVNQLKSKYISERLEAYVYFGGIKITQFAARVGKGLVKKRI